jgi:5-formyltetrahydrofolate cyclo-ligase
VPPPSSPNPSPEPDHAALAHAKSQLRAHARGSLASIDPAQRAAWSQSIRRHLAAHPRFQTARRLLAFAPLPDEPDLAPLLLQVIADGRTIALPRVHWATGAMTPAVIADWMLDLTPSNPPTPASTTSPAAARPALLEPSAHCPSLDPSTLDLVLVPGLAFDRAGRRLGRGRGFYDRFLTALGPGVFKLGIAFWPQVVDSVPAGPEDCPVDAIVNDLGTIATHPAHSPDRLTDDGR